MRIKKKILKLYDKIDDDKILTKNFYEYVEKIVQSQRLIIKSKNGYHCDNCDYNFKPKINYKVGSYHNCPRCHKKLLVKTNKLQKIEQVDVFAVLDRIDNYFIIRAFEVKTWYNKGLYESHICEYARQTYDINDFLNNISEAYNDNINATISGKYVIHRSLFGDNWRENGSYYHTLGEIYKLYPYNIKKVLKDSKWQYSQLDKFAKKIDYFCITDFLRMNPRTLEMLMKNKLYFLTYDLIKRCSRGYLIEVNYKFIKQNLEYIRKHRLTINEIVVFEYIKSQNIKIIKKYSNVSDHLKRFKRWKINFETADREILNLNNKIYEYYDYLMFAEELGYDMKDKKILYPKNMIEEHNKLQKMVEIKNSKKIDSSIRQRSKQLSKNKFQDKKYIIFPASSYESMIDESSQMNNCVKTYAERIAIGECDIYFMRLLENTSKSLVTVEVRDNKVVQKRTKNNYPTTPGQDKFLEMWEKKVLGGNS